MTALAGIGASVKEASTAFSNASKWDVDIKGAVKDATPFGATGNFVINVPTLNSWTAKITAFLDTADAAQVAMFNAIGTLLALTFLVGGGTHQFAGSAYLTDMAASVDVQNVESIVFSYTGSGTVTYT